MIPDSNRIIVDTNVIFDVLHSDPKWKEWSHQQLESFAGRLVINPLIFSELCYQAKSLDEANSIVTDLLLGFVELPRYSLYLASKAFGKYRQQGGTKTSPLADFFIGAHAEAQGLPILTRDENRYKTYFPTVPLISP